MKGRSHRLPPSDPPDDWGDGSWTVDCSCGVNFDDGEEMVSCDECGVWVHTRCSRFVRGEASFACHKCKAARRPRPSAADDRAHDAEETEVAQLLVELPTKADPCPPSASLLPHRPHFRPWVPLEERVHVQGIPGGDSSLFRGLSSVFTSELWRCTGYVPKKFNFQYQEFPCWDDEEGETPASMGADVLFSLSKEIDPYVPVRAAFEARPSPEGVREQEGEKASYGSRSQSSVKKERSKLRLLGPHLSKRRKEEYREGKDWSGKKRSRSEPDRAAASSKKRGSIPLVDMNKAGFCKDGGLQVAESDNPVVKNEVRKDDMLSEPNFTDGHERMENGNKSKHILVIKASRGGLPDEALRKTSLETTVKVEKDDDMEPAISCKADAFPASCGEGSDAAKESVIEEDVSKAVHGPKQSKDENHSVGDLNGTSDGVALDSENSKSALDVLRSTCPDVADTPVARHSDGVISLSSKLDRVEMKLEEDDEKLHATDHLPQHLEKSIGNSENLQEHGNVANLPSDEQKSQDADKDLEASYQTCDIITDVKVSRFSEPKPHEQVVEPSRSSTVQRESLELKHGSKCVDEPTKSGGSDQSLPTPNVRKLVAGFGQASSASSAPGFSRSSVSGSCKSLGTTTCSTIGKAIHSTKQQRVKVATCTAGNIDNVSAIECAEENMHEISIQPVKDHPKGSEWSGSKSPSMSKASNASASKGTITDSKEQLLSPSSTASTIIENTTILSSSGEATGSLQTQKDSVQIKLMSSGLCQKNEKINQAAPQSSSKVHSHLMAMHPPPSVNATTLLSDEELALLLHQELNSSPRVPRVPRIRQAASMQLVTPTVSMLKRSSSGGKDQASFFRRKSKEDASRDGSRSLREFIDESKRTSRAPSSPDRKHREPVSTTDGSAKKDSRNRSPENATLVKKNNSVSPVDAGNGCPPTLESSGQKGSSTRSSPRDVQEDDASLTCRTLPGLIDEILSKGRCTTYEELCDTVCPHWHNLRKPNGERYAYSSHSHAVLDCLRNRSEWAHLIDRGPKTNSSKRRRKPDPDTVESDSEETRNRTPRRVEDKSVESQHQEYYPKRKRTRTNRQMEVRDRSSKEEAMKSHNQDANSDGDPAASSRSSSEDDDDEGHGADQPAADEVSSSSS